MQYKKLTEDQRTLMHGRNWIYAKATQLQTDKGYSRRKAIELATCEYRKMRLQKLAGPARAPRQGGPRKKAAAAYHAQMTLGKAPPTPEAAAKKVEMADRNRVNLHNWVRYQVRRSPAGR